jgi:hypothetical protein
MKNRISNDVLRVKFLQHSIQNPLTGCHLVSRDVLNSVGGNEFSTTNVHKIKTPGQKISKDGFS